MINIIKSILLTLIISISFSSAHAQQTKNKTKILLAMGDGLFLSRSVKESPNLPQMIEANLVGRNYDVKLIDKSFPGFNLELSELILKKVINEKPKPNVAMVTIGLNDIKADKSLKYIYTKTSKMIDTLVRNNISVVLIGFALPEDVPDRYKTKRYRTKLQEIYMKIVNQYKISYYPNIFNGLNDKIYYRSVDKYHLNEKGIQYAGNKIYPLVLKELNK